MDETLNDKQQEIEINREELKKTINTDIYPNINDTNFLSKIYNKLEFIINERSDAFSYEKELDIDGLQLSAHQLFVQNFISIHTPYKKMLLFHAVGTGKTLSAWSAAKTFINEFKKYSKDEVTPKIFIVGFTENLFKLEFTKWTELGFVDDDDINFLSKIKKQYGFHSPEYIKERANIYSRLSDRKYNGFYKFYGYQELYNKLFIKKTGFDINIDDNETNIHTLLQYIKDGEININHELLESFENSLLICDEVHNTYNSDEINNYGQCILYITYFIKNIKTMFMTATPLNNNAREIIDLMNLLSDNINEYISSDIYDEILSKPNHLELLETLIKKNLKGKISVFENIDLRYYPERIFIGEKIKNINLLKFVKCYMSDYYFDKYLNLINYDKINNSTTFSILNKIFEDIILPDNLNDDKLIINQSSAWKSKNLIDFDVYNGYSFGDLYYYKNLKKYSPKYYEMLMRLNDTVGKVFIYHNNINKSGVNMIASILRENGYIEFDDVTSASTRCSVCKKLFNDRHVNHDFQALRFILYTGLSVKNTLRELIAIYNHPQNIHGHMYKVLIGSRIISEGVTLKEVNDCFIVTLPVNISKMIQVIGRCTRNNTHTNHDIDRQYVNISIFLHSMTDQQKKQFKSHFNVNYDLDKIYSIEEYHYKEKTDNHMDIQHIEKIIKEIAIDGLLYPSNTYDDDLGYMFNPLKDQSISVSYKHIDDFSFIHHNFIDNVLDFTIIYIKNLLNEHKIMHINDILEFFKTHDYIIEFNTKLINENYIRYVINKLLVYNNVNNNIINNYYNIDNKKIIRIDDYILLVSDINNIYNDIFDTQHKTKTINLLHFVDNVDNDIINIYKNVENSILVLTDFFNVFNNNIPTNILKNELNKSNNKIIKKIMKNAKINKKNINDIIGIIDSSQKFKIKNSVFDKGITCTSLKKTQFILYLSHILHLEPHEITSKTIKELSILTRNILLEMELNDEHTLYFKINL